MITHFTEIQFNIIHKKIHKKLFKAGLKRINKYTPAVTKVEE
jgi:hypothetical protein